VIYDSVLDLIGQTPLVRLKKVSSNFSGEVIAKLENLNPGGSIKDRIAKYILEKAQKQGKLTEKSVVIEATSGNTGIGLALVCAVWKIRCIIVMPENMSIERQKILRQLGAELVLTPGDQGMAGAVNKAQEIAASLPCCFEVRQFANPDNVNTHYELTALEIWEQTQGQIDVFVAGIGSGGTLTGVGKKLKELKPQIKVCAVEPASSAVLSGKSAGKHQIQGIGPGFVPPIVEKEIIDQVIQVSDQEAIEMTRRLIGEEGLLVGISSGANCVAALKLAKEKKQMVVFPCPDLAERYLSTNLFVE